jgi:prepilin-type N-terminal cleavage/methylation domain-containing protein
MASSALPTPHGNPPGSEFSGFYLENGGLNMEKPPGKQPGFTLIEIAVVLVIVGLLLGGALAGQALVESAKAKRLAGDFREIPAAVLAYQDKYKRLPGDDNRAQARWGLATGRQGNGDGRIGGEWDSNALSAESALAWLHLREARILPGSTDFSSASAASLPVNAQGGRLGLSSKRPISSLRAAAFYVCSDAISGKLAQAVDAVLDDGEAGRGAMQAVVRPDAGKAQADGSHPAAQAYDEALDYTICMEY